MKKLSTERCQEAAQNLWLTRLSFLRILPAPCDAALCVSAIRYKPDELQCFEREAAEVKAELNDTLAGIM